MSLDFLNLPEWLSQAFAIAGDVAFPVFGIISGIVILILMSVIKKKTDDKVKEYKQLIDVLQQLNGKEDPNDKINSLLNKIDEMEKSYTLMTNALEVIFTNANLPQSVRDKLATIFSHVKTKDYDALLREAQAEAEKLKEEIRVLTEKVITQKAESKQETTEVNVQRA